MDPENQKLAVIGGGSWGTALVKILQHNDRKVFWWVRRESQKQHILAEKHNPYYLSYTELDTDKLFVSNDIKEILNRADIIFPAIPSAFLVEVFKPVFMEEMEGKTIVSAVKGIEPKTLLPVFKWFMQRFNIPAEQIGVIGGPCHAEEVVMQRKAFLTLGTSNTATGEMISKLLNTPFLNIEVSNDVDGISIAAVLKNVYGILAGISNGLRFGDNFQAVLVSNAVREMECVLKNISGNSRNIYASVYAGDLLVTAYSGFSRNWMLGNLIGKGHTVKNALLELKMIAEGYYASESLKNMQDVDITKYPLLNTAYEILHENKAPGRTLSAISKHLK